jgi:hypothetical protein
MIFLIAGTFRLEGTLDVGGLDGQRVDTLNSANFPAGGGRGVCGGGDGGAGSPQTIRRSISGQSGYGPMQYPALGGAGGVIACTVGSRPAPGGGGGSFATQGDPWYKIKSAAGNVFPQQKGVGGWGAFRKTPGGAPGPAYFQDGNAGNNFIGLGYDVYRRQVIPGELTIAVGGSGGGGGGDASNRCTINDPNFYFDEKGGGGGAGGGVVLIIAEGKIILGKVARLSADGGDGGGGAWVGSSNNAGGGAGGAGGLIALYTRSHIDITIQGETYANKDYVFAVSADGGVGQLSPFGGSGGNVSGKYPPTTAKNMDAKPAGGMGGMGLIQFMTRPGTNTDGTNTVFDDNIILHKGTTVLTGAEKQRYLAWRGFPNAAGVWVDDSGRATAIGDKEGDFRPTPILLPVF